MKRGQLIEEALADAANVEDDPVAKAALGDVLKDMADDEENFFWMADMFDDVDTARAALLNAALETLEDESRGTPKPKVLKKRPRDNSSSARCD